MPIRSTYINHLTLSSKTFWRLRLLTRLSKPFSLSSSSSPVPTHEHIARLILDQKSPSQALQTFKWASDLPNFTHSQSTYRALVSKLCNFRYFNDVHQVLEEMPASIGSPPDEDIFVTFISGLGRAQRIREVIRVLDLVVKFDMQPSMKIYNSILDVLVKEDIDIARGFYRKKMMDCGVKGDDYTFGILMKGLCLTNRIADGFKLLQLIKSRCLRPNTVVYNTLLHALCKNGKVGRARSLMNEMPEPNGVTYNILVSAYCEEGNMVQAIVLLEKCFSSNLIPDIITVTKVAEMLCNVGRPNEAVEIMDRFEVNGGKIDVVAYNTLIKGFCDIGKARVAVRYLKEMERKGCFPSADTYNELINGFCEIDMVDLALELFNDMKTDGINWNFVTFDTLIKGLCSKGFVDEGFKILELMEDHKGGFGGRISPYNSILYGLYLKNRREEALAFLSKMERMFPKAVDRTLKILGFCEEGSVVDAMKVYEQMIKEGGLPSVFVFARLIHSLSYQNCVREAFVLMNEMISLEYFPTSSTYNVLISSFCSQGKVSSALNLLEDMVARGCLPDSGAYNPIINVFCQKGDLENALEILQHMVDADIVPTVEMWTSLVFLLSKDKLGLETRRLFCINI